MMTMTAQPDSRNGLRYVAAFRAYEWDADIAVLAARFFAACPNARHVVLMNESRGPVDVGPYEKIAHTDDFSAFGLPEYPAGISSWYNSDYSYYYLGHVLPGYDHYLISESDVSVNMPLEDMMRHARDHSVDALLHQVKPAEEDWYFYEDALAQDAPARAFMFIAAFSPRALQCMYEARSAIVRRRAEADATPWPVAESLIPTALLSADMVIEEIAQFGDTTNLNFRPHLSLRDPRAVRPGSLAHAVIGSRRITQIARASEQPSDVFAPDTELGSLLQHESPADISAALEAAFLRTQDHAGLSRWHAVLRHAGLQVEAHADLAFGKPAIVSSTSQWSHHASPLKEACGANGTRVADDFAFHTDEEDSPWWQVDLMDEYVIDEVRIVNRRRGEYERFRTFAIDSSRDGASWRLRYTKLDAGAVSNDPTAPWTLRLEDPFVARFLRIRLIADRPAPLHLTRVQVFGRPISAAAERL